MAKTPNKRTGESGDIKPVERLNVDYIKANHFRTLSPSGLMSSITPQGQIQVAFFSERQAIPQRIVYSLLANGEMGEPLEQVGRDAIVREVECAISLDLRLAEGLAQRLKQLIEEIKEGENGEKHK